MITDQEVKLLSGRIADVLVDITEADAENNHVLIPNQKWLEASLIAGAVFFCGVLIAEGREHGFTIEEFLGTCERLSKCKTLTMDHSILTDIREELANPPKSS